MRRLNCKYGAWNRKRGRNLFGKKNREGTVEIACDVDFFFSPSSCDANFSGKSTTRESVKPDFDFPALAGARPNLEEEPRGDFLFPLVAK